MFKIGMDTGGTFTDLVVADGAGTLHSFKVPSTPDDPLRSVVGALERAASFFEIGLADFLGQVSLFIYGTTIVTNAVITKSGVKTGMITTKGFEDITYFRMGKKWGHTIYDFKITHPRPIVPGHLRFGVEERMRFTGHELTPLNEAEVRTAACAFRDQGVESVAICFLNSYENPTHEQRAAEICAQEYPDLYVVQSAQVTPAIREWERFTTAVISAYVGPLIKRYLEKMESRLRETGFRGHLLIMQSNGGTSSVRETVSRAALTLNSGPSAGPSAAIKYDEVFDLRKIASVDLGGTSLDMSTVVDRSIPTISRKLIDGERVAFKMIDCHNLGAGGGSIAGFDQVGLLAVGPRSAGAVPGPMCYGQGGTEVTVTDANVVLGYIPDDFFLGGRMKLDRRAAERGLKDLARELKLKDMYEAARAVSTVVNHNIAAAVLGFLVERGHDPRDFVLMAGGGASGVQMAEVALQAHIPRVIIPRFASTYCAVGMLYADIIHDYVRSYRMLTRRANLERLNAYYELMEKEATATLLAEGIPVEDQRLVRSADMRYAGQYRELEVPVPSDRLTPESIRLIEEAFHRRHEEVLLFSSDEGLPQFVHLRVKAVGLTDKPQLQRVSKGNFDTATARKGIRRCYFDSFVETPVYDGPSLRYGNQLVGPAIVDELETTVVVPPGFWCRVDEFGGYWLEHRGESNRLRANGATQASLTVPAR